jgi:hypothetical protein
MVDIELSGDAVLATGLSGLPKIQKDARPPSVTVPSIEK